MEVEQEKAELQVTRHCNLYLKLVKKKYLLFLEDFVKRNFLLFFFFRHWLCLRVHGHLNGRSFRSSSNDPSPALRRNAWRGDRGREVKRNARSAWG